MSSALISTIPTESELRSYKIIAEVAANNQHWKKVGGSGTFESIVATIFSIMLLAREIGVSPILAIAGGINNVNGKFEISARTMNQLIRQRGHKIMIKVSNDQLCTIWAQRKDTGEEMEVSYHIEEAARSGLVREGSPWKKVPSDMLFARAISRLARRGFPDCIGGCYIEGELKESMNGDIMKSEEIQDISHVKNEIEIKAVTPTILVLPETINPEEAEAFIQESAAQCKSSVENIRARAAQNMEGFLKQFEKWKIKKKEEDDLKSFNDEMDSKQKDKEGA